MILWRLTSIHFFFIFSVVSLQNEPPPPYYSVAVHTQPPLKSYEEVVYGAGPGLTPSTQPHYIPQYPPPVTAPQVTHSSTRECSPTFPYFSANTKAAAVRAKQIETQLLRGLLMCFCVLFTLCVQLPGVRAGGDAARVIPSVTEGQGESYCCLLCWHWPSGLEVHCVYSYRSLDIVINIHLLLGFVWDYCACKVYVSHNVPLSACCSEFFFVFLEQNNVIQGFLPFPLSLVSFYKILVV